MPVERRYPWKEVGELGLDWSIVHLGGGPLGMCFGPRRLGGGSGRKPSWRQLQVEAQVRGEGWVGCQGSVRHPGGRPREHLAWDSGRSAELETMRAGVVGSPGLCKAQMLAEVTRRKGRRAESRVAGALRGQEEGQEVHGSGNPGREGVREGGSWQPSTEGDRVEGGAQHPARPARGLGPARSWWEVRGRQGGGAGEAGRGCLFTLCWEGTQEAGVSGRRGKHGRCGGGATTHCAPLCVRHVALLRTEEETTSEGGDARL